MTQTFTKQSRCKNCLDKIRFKMGHLYLNQVNKNIVLTTITKYYKELLICCLQKTSI